MPIGHSRTNVFGLPALLLLAAGLGLRDVDTEEPCSAPAAMAATPRRPFVSEHRYRIVGKVRLLLFWVGSDDVGGARATWRADDGDGRAFSLLIGSDPRRAPRGINEWGYIHERVRGDNARVFGVRTVTEPDSPDDATAKLEARKDRTTFGALCAQVNAREAQASIATLSAPSDVTYQHFDRLLDAVAASSALDFRQVTRPDDAAPGFLTALDRLMTITADATRARRSGFPNTIGYVYKDSTYDLNARRVQSIAELKTEAGVFRNLLRAEFTIRNRQTNDSTRFNMTYGLDGALAGVPVEATYQPNWWLKVRLELDDRSQLPADPSGDEILRQRMDDVCALALRIGN